MKIVKKAGILLLSLIVLLMCLSAGASVINAYGPTTYTVRVFAGNLGRENNQNASSDQGAYWTQTYSAGEYCTLPLSSAKASFEDGSKYYVKGFKESGLGGETALHEVAFAVDHDYDFIIAYGMPNNQTTYTIHFVDYETGAALADPITYYGNVGDKPVVAYQYIEGYRPLYRNITGTLAANGNEWSFPYVSLAAEAQQETTAAAQPTAEPQTDAQGQLIESEVVTNANGAIIQSEVVTDANGETVPVQNGGTAQTPAGEETTEMTAEGQAPAAGGGETTTTAGGTQNAAEPEGGQTAGGNTTANTPGNTPGTTEPQTYDFPETEDIFDLDVPLAAPSAAGGNNADAGEDESTSISEAEAAQAEASDLAGETTHAKSLSTNLIVIIIAACIVIIVIVLIVVLRKKGKK